MASQFKCNNCDSVYALRSEAVTCCASVEEQIFYVCPYCDEQYEDKNDAENCCSYIELHNIDDYRALFLPLYNPSDSEFVLTSESSSDFISQISENIFKIVLPNAFVYRTMTDAMNLICSINLIKVNENSLEINCNRETLSWMTKYCIHIISLVQAKPYWSLKLSDIGGLQRLSELLKNNGVDIDQNEILNDQLTQEASTLNIDITNGEIFLTNNEGNQILLKINHVNQSIETLDPQWLLVKPNQTEAVSHD